MAIIHELWDSRTGASRGLDGVSGENRLWSIKAEPGDVITVKDGSGGTISDAMPDPRTLLTDSGIAVPGHVHPWDFSQRLLKHVIVETRSRGSWIVRSDYVSFQAVAPLDQEGDWLLSVRGATVTKQIIEELSINDSAIVEKGSRRGVELQLDPPLRGVASENIRLIGPTRFIKATKMENGEYEADAIFQAKETVKVVDGEGKETGATQEVDVRLRATSKRKIEPRTEEFPALAVSFTKIVPNFDINKASVLAQYMKASNRIFFRGAQPGHVLVNDLTIDPIAAEMAGQDVAGRSWRISTSLLWSSEPWTPYGLVPTYIDDTGLETTVTYAVDDGNNRQGDKVKEFFRVKRTNDLESMFKLLEGAK